LKTPRFWDDKTGRVSTLQERILQLRRLGYSWAAAKETAWQEELAQKRADEILENHQR